MKLVGGDSGRYEREAFVEEVMLAPSERAVIDVMFDKLGDVRLEHRTPDRVYDLGAFSVGGTSAGSAGESFEELRVDPHLTAEHGSIADDLSRPPDKVLAFVASMPLLYGDDVTAATSYACPMHPEVTSSEPGKCPKCGMQLLPARSEEPSAVTYTCPMHPEVISSEPGTCPKCGMKLVPSGTLPSPQEDARDHAAEHHEEQSDGLEWEDLMPEINRASEPSNMRWMLIDRQTGAENGAITWAFTVGDRVKIRLVNEMESDHPMHHPFHVHGAGRFLVLSRDGEAESNLVWKDTVLVPAGRTVDILLDVSNPGLWMAHCHIAEHAQSGMMFSFNVSRREPAEVAT
jgi:FtsP/CotA-like multicopper oxidase with cupredoxin domain